MATIPNKIAQLIETQLHNELAAHISYLAMSAFFERGAFKGFAHWMRLQAMEEHVHAMRFFDYLNDRGHTVVLKGIAAPKAEFKSPSELFRTALKQEEQVTQSIHAIYQAATAAGDYATVEMLNWFLKEQVEEEKSATDILDRVELAGDDTAALLQLDHEALKRKGE